MESQVNTYKLNQGDKEYMLTISTIGNKIRITCKNTLNEKIKFSRDFSVEDLKRTDNIFNTINSPFEALNYIDRALKVEKVGVSEEGDTIKINFYLKEEDIGHNLEIPLGTNQIIQNTTTTTTYDINQVYGSTQDNTAQYLSEFNNGSYQTQYNVDNSADILQSLQNINLTADSSSAQYTTGQDYTAQYTTGEDLTSQYTTGFQDLNSQYQYGDTVIDTTTQYTNTFDSTPYITPTTDYNNQYLNTYQTTTQTVETTNQYIEPTQTFESKAYITPVEDQTSGTDFNTYEKTTTITKTQNVPDERIDRLVGDTTSLKSEHQLIHDKLNDLTGQINAYKTKIELMEKEKASNEVNRLRAENRAIKQQLTEYNNLRNDAAEVRVLRTQLAELYPLRKKAAEMEVLKGQLSELQSLRAKVAELNAVKPQLAELNNLRAQASQMNVLKQQLKELQILRAKLVELNGVKSQLSELNNLKAQVGQIKILKEQLKELRALKDNAIDAENLKKKLVELEKIKIQYEEEIKNLRNTQTRSQGMDSRIIEFGSKTKSSGMESKQLLFEDRPQQICVKGDIIHNTDELELLIRKINKLNQKLTLNLLYKATADSDKASAFHAKCDDARSTLVLVETDKGRRFGGFTNCSWAGDCIDKKDEDAFVFSLDKMEIYENIPGEDAIGCYPKFGPIFLGCQIRIYDNAFEKGGTTFEKGLNYYTEEDFELTGGEREFSVREIEVYEVIPQ